MAPAKAGESSIQSSASSSSAASTSSSHGGSLELSSSSHSIAKKQHIKKQPIIRVVHVCAPKLIKTDPANFRVLVQKLTGNTAPKHEEKFEATHDHASPFVHDYHNGPANIHSGYVYAHEGLKHKHVGSYSDFEEVGDLASLRPLKKEINDRELSFSADFATIHEINTLQLGQNLEDHTLENGFLLSTNYCGELARLNGDGDGEGEHNLETASINETDENANLANHFESARTAEIVIIEDHCFATSCSDDADAYIRYMSSPSSLEASSISWNTKNAMTFVDRDDFYEGFELMGSFSEHQLMQLNSCHHL